MKSMKKTMSIVLALLLLVSTVTAVSAVSVSAEDPVENVLFTTLTEANFVGYGSYSIDKVDEDGKKVVDDAGNIVKEDVVYKPKTITFNDDLSFRMESDGLVTGVKAIFKVDESAKANFAQCIKNAEVKYNDNVEKAKKKAEDEGTEFDINNVSKVAPFANIAVFVENAMNAKNVQVDNQTIFSVIMKDGTVRALNTLWMDYKQTNKSAVVSFSYKEKYLKEDGTEGTKDVFMESFDDVEKFQVEMYHWNEAYRTVVIGSPVVSGTSAIPVKPDVLPDEGAGVGTTIINFDKTYRQDYSNEPDKVTYSATADGKFKTSGSGFVKFELSNAGEPGNQKQAYFKFDREVAAKGIAAANKEGGSKMAEMTVTIESCVDQHGNPVKAQVDILVNSYAKGYVTLFKEWQEPGTAVTYQFDVSEYGNYGIAGVRLAVENYWYYDKDGNIVEFSEKNEKNPGTGVELIQIRTSTMFTPITVSDGSQKQVGTVTTVPTTTGSGEVEGAGYEFFIYEKETQAVEWGNSPVEVKYNENGTVQLISPKGIARPGCDFKQHQMGWLSHTSEDNKTTISDEKNAAVLARMQQALDYANAPGAPGLLAVDVTVNSAWNPGNEKDCSVEILLMIHATDDLAVKVMQYVGKGVSKTIYLDVSGLTDAKAVGAWHIAAQNYANTDQKTGAACGLTDVDVTFSNPYVAGSALATTEKVTVPANNDVAKQLADLYNELPKDADAYTSSELYYKLEEFVTMYIDCGDATQAFLEKEYGITMDDYAVLLNIWNELPSPDDVETGNTAMPICAVALAAAAAYVIARTRNKK